MGRDVVYLRLVSGRVGKFKPRRWSPGQVQVFVVDHHRFRWRGATRRYAGNVLVSVEPRGFASSCTELTLPQWASVMMRRKVPDLASSTARPQAPQATKLLLKLQNIVQQVSLTSYDDGTERKPGILMVFTHGNLWRVLVKDPDTDAKLVVTQESLDEALLAMELLLGSPDTMWEIDQYAKPEKKRRGK